MVASQGKSKKFHRQFRISDYFGKKKKKKDSRAGGQCWHKATVAHSLLASAVLLTCMNPFLETSISSDHSGMNITLIRERHEQKLPWGGIPFCLLCQHYSLLSMWVSPICYSPSSVNFCVCDSCFRTCKRHIK